MSILAAARERLCRIFCRDRGARVLTLADALYREGRQIHGDAIRHRDGAQVLGRAHHQRDAALVGEVGGVQPRRYFGCQHREVLDPRHAATAPEDANERSHVVVGGGRALKRDGVVQERVGGVLGEGRDERSNMLDLAAGGGVHADVVGVCAENRMHV